MIIAPDTIDRNMEIAADVCVVGSGAGGAVVAGELAEAGHSVIVIEEGPYLVNADFVQRETVMYRRLYRDQMARTSPDMSVLVLQGQALGGSTLASFCLCVRPPREILDQWRARSGVAGIDAAAMRPHFARVERVVGARPIADADLNANNLALRLGAGRLGYRGFVPANNRTDCLGCGYCALGCAYDRKGDAMGTYLSAASRAGATLLPGCRVEHIEVARGRVVGAVAVAVGRGGHPRTLRVRAAAVVLAAGALGSVRLWLRSRLPNANRQVGRNLHLHPQIVVAAEFDDPIEGWKGIPQAFVIDQFLKFEKGGGGGCLLAPTFAHPVACGSLLPGIGADHRRLMERYSRLAMATVILHDRTAGSVEADGSGRTMISYHLGDEDRIDLMDGMRRLAEIYFAAGARRVVLPYTDLVELAERSDDRLIEERGVRANDPLLFSYQPHGTLRMGDDPKLSVVSGSGEAHKVRDLFVADASVLPGAAAVPPQLAIMALATRTAQFIGARLKRGA